MRNEMKSAFGGKKEKGFTLIELLVVIAIIGILAILIFLALQRAQASARDAQRKAFARDIATAEVMFYDSHKTYGHIIGGGGPNSLHSDGLIGQWPRVCPNGAASNPDSACINDSGSWNAWEGAMSNVTKSTFIVTTNMEKSNASFVCDQNGCRDQ